MLSPHINVITLGVADLDRGLAFYTALGWSSHGIVGTEYVGDDSSANGAVVMFTLDGGLVLALYPRAELAKDAGVAALPDPGSCMSLGHIVERREDVDEALELAAQAGGRVIGAPHDRPWGIYSGYFADPDGHLWEVIAR